MEFFYLHLLIDAFCSQSEIHNSTKLFHQKNETWVMVGYMEKTLKMSYWIF